MCIAQCPSDHHAMCNMRPNHSCAWMDRTDSGQSHNWWATPGVKPTTMIAGRKIPLRRVPPSSRITPCHCGFEGRAGGALVSRRVLAFWTESSTLRVVCGVRSIMHCTRSVTLLSSVVHLRLLRCPKSRFQPAQSRRPTAKPRLTWVKRPETSVRTARPSVSTRAHSIHPTSRGVCKTRSLAGAGGAICQIDGGKYTNKYFIE